MMNKEWDKDRFQRGFLLLLLLAVSVVFLRMISLFLIPLLLAALFAGMSYPLYLKLLGILRGRKGLAAVFTLAVLVALVVVPLTGFLGIVVEQAGDMTASVAPWVQEELSQEDLLSGLMERVPDPARRFLPEADRVMAKVGELAGRVGAFLVNSMAALTRGTASFFLGLFILLYAMYFFLVSGREALARLLYLMPLNSAQENRLLDRFTSVTRATVRGTLLIGLIQGALGGLGFLVLGIPGWAFWGTIMAVLSIIPAVGAALIWVPAVLYLVVVGQVMKAVILLVWCAVVVSSSDNVLRPRLVGRDAKMPDLMILVGTLGGITMFGATGVILGPLVAALFLTVWDLYGEAFGEGLDEVTFPGEQKVEAPAG
ncbi:MAG: AI-2E family transporter [Longimicrobiales bacterium]